MSLEETSSATPARAALAVDVPSDAEPPTPRASSRNSPAEVPVSGACFEEVSGVERGRRRKSVARRISSRRAAIEESHDSEEEPGENPFNDRDLIKSLIIRNSNSKVEGLMLGIKSPPQSKFVSGVTLRGSTGVQPLATSFQTSPAAEPPQHSQVLPTDKPPPASIGFCTTDGPHPSFYLEDFIQTPTGAGLHPRLRLQEGFIRTPTGEIGRAHV